MEWNRGKELIIAPLFACELWSATLDFWENPSETCCEELASVVYGGGKQMLLVTASSLLLFPAWTPVPLENPYFESPFWTLQSPQYFGNGRNIFFPQTKLCLGIRASDSADGTLKHSTRQRRWLCSGNGSSLSPRHSFLSAQPCTGIIASSNVQELHQRPQSCQLD